MTPINDLINGFFNWGYFTPFFVAVSVPSTDPNPNPNLDGFPQSATTPHRHVKRGQRRLTCFATTTKEGKTLRPHLFLVHPSFYIQISLGGNGA